MDGDYHRPYKFDFSCFRVGKVKKKSHCLLVIGAVGTAGGTKRTGGDGTPPLQYLISADTGSKK